MKKRLAIAMILSLFLTALILNGCSDESPSLSFPESELPVISFQGFQIPHFPTAQGQLNYARSGFANPEEKKAALQILFRIFPEDRLQCGNVALYLAYMNLGYDYRFATKQDYANAITAYHDVIENFKAYPQVLVTAYWYLGWIHCDLLKENELGIPFFWYIVKTYPHIETGISSPVPWVSLVYPLAITENQPVKPTANKQWASLSLLEIIRHASKRNEVFTAFDILWKDYQDTVATGLAIKLMLCNETYAQKAIPYIEKYLAMNIANKYLAKEIKSNARQY